jgi:hypothetical protein
LSEGENKSKRKMVKFMESILRFQNYIHGNNPSSNSSCPSSPVTWCMDDSDESKLCIQNPTLLPACILALIIGLYCSKRISKLPGKFPSRWFYQITFFLYGMMMTSAGILHCFLGDSNKLTTNTDDPFQYLQFIVTVLDVGLSTNIAVTFLFCGLCDIHLFNPQAICTRYLLFLSYFIVFLLWTLGVLNEWKWIYNVLYLGVIAFCCFIYLLTQLSIKSKHSSLLALISAGIYGGIGLLAKSVGANRICNSEGPFWSHNILDRNLFGFSFLILVWHLYVSMLYILIDNAKRLSINILLILKKIRKNFKTFFF